MITYLTSHGLSDAQIQLISGHEGKKSLWAAWLHVRTLAVSGNFADTPTETRSIKFL
jgi:hypothetical protein